MSSPLAEREAASKRARRRLTARGTARPHSGRQARIFPKRITRPPCDGGAGRSGRRSGCAERPRCPLSVVARSASIGGELGELGVQIALQRERLAQARLVAGQPRLRVERAGAALRARLHPVEAVFQPGDAGPTGVVSPSMSIGAEVRPFQREVRLQPRVMPARRLAGQVEAADAADRPGRRRVPVRRGGFSSAERHRRPCAA